MTNQNISSSAKKVKTPEPTLESLKKEIVRLQKSEKAALKKLQQQKLIEKQFEESQTRFESIFKQSILGNKIITPDLKIIQVNKALTKMLGYSKKELIGTKITTFSHPDFIHHWKELQTNLWEQQIPSFQIETCLIKNDGGGLWCRVTSILFQNQGESLGYTIVEDISQRKKMEMKLKKLYENQETIMHMVAHDLKSPLHNIMLAANFLKENLEELLIADKEKEEDTFNFVNLISETSEKALIIIDDLITIGEIETIYSNLEEINLAPYLRNNLKYLFVEANKKEIAINFKFPSKPVFARIHKDKFIRAVANLVSNGIKFTKPGGQVTISLARKKKRTILEVRDNGIGIPEKLLPKVFDKFTKANRLGTKGEPTTGLGLFIVKQIIEKHQGKIWVESQENIGTSFFIALV